MIPLSILVALSGPVLSAGLFTYFASTTSDLGVALLGLVGTCVSSGSAVYITIKTQRRVRITERKIVSVERKVSAPRRIAASAGDEGGVVIQPPDVEDDQT